MRINGSNAAKFKIRENELNHKDKMDLDWIYPKTANHHCKPAIEIDSTRTTKAMKTQKLLGKTN